jgi:predicted nucleic acid-binding protein
MKYHVNNVTMNVNPCKAKSPETCPFYRGPNQTMHSDTPEEARKDAERLIERNGRHIVVSKQGLTVMKHKMRYLTSELKNKDGKSREEIDGMRTELARLTSIVNGD